MQKLTINYRQIYTDILNKKYPHKKQECKAFLEKDELSTIDIIELNKKIFGHSDKETEIFNQKHKSYNQVDMLKILEFQHKNNLNNTQLAKHFKLSRNTVSKWKKIFIL